MRIFRRYEEHLIARGFLHSVHTKSERMAGVWTGLFIWGLAVVAVLAVLDHLILGGSLIPVLRPLGIAALVSFGIGCILIVLSINRLI